MLREKASRKLPSHHGEMRSVWPVLVHHKAKKAVRWRTYADLAFQLTLLGKFGAFVDCVKELISALMLDTGHLILDKPNNFKRMIQHPVSSIQYLTAMKYSAKNFPKIHGPKIFF